MTRREILTSDAIRFALEWLEQHKVEIEPLKSALAERMAQWEHGREVPKRQREAIVEVAAARAVRHHIEKLRSRRGWWQQG